MSIVAALAAYLCQRFSQQLSAGVLCLLLLISNASLLPMLSRFYTVHYLFGAILCLLALLLIHRQHEKNQLNRPATLVALFSLTLLALLAKEVYIMLLPILWLVFWRVRAKSAALAVTAALISYFALRIYILGLSSDGRDGQSFLSALLAVRLESWLGFIQWYLTTKWLICATALVALIRAPRTMLLYLVVAGLFTAPSLAAPHAFQNPQLHGDRLFFMFDVALIVASVLALYSRPINNRLITLLLIFTSCAYSFRYSVST